jgi:hypothetical protein
VSEEHHPFGRGSIERFARWFQLATKDASYITATVDILRTNHCKRFAELVLSLDGAAMLLRQHRQLVALLDKHRCDYLRCKRLATYVDATDHPAKLYCDEHTNLDDGELRWAEELRCLEEICQMEKGR